MPRLDHPGHVRRVTRPTRRVMKRRAAVEPVISHLKAEHRMGRNYLKGRRRPHQRRVAAGYNFSLLPALAEQLLRAVLHALLPPPIFPISQNYRSIVLHG
jgi:IS5 family transposase